MCWTCPQCGSADVSAEGGVTPPRPDIDAPEDAESDWDDTCEMTCNACQHQDLSLFFAKDLEQP